jgi:hypothetical protein
MLVFSPINVHLLNFKNYFKFRLLAKSFWVCCLVFYEWFSENLLVRDSQKTQLELKLDNLLPYLISQLSLSWDIENF